MREREEIARPIAALVGRERLLALVEQTLTNPDIQMITLTGPAGAGKTRLAREAASSVRATFADGACFVDLSPVQQTERVLPAIANALGLPEPGNERILMQIARDIGDRRQLLVLDNFEQVAAAAPVVAELLGQCPGLTALLTSRTRLLIAGECEIEVPPLEPEATARLFVQRARMTDPSFSGDGADRERVTEIVELLDGLPLAIELAAARLTVLSLEELRRTISDHVEVLASHSPAWPERQRTLRGAIAWSEALLSASARAAFLQLGVFADAFDLPVAGAVVIGPEAEPVTSLDPAFPVNSWLVEAMAELVDASLLQRIASSSNRPRFRMLHVVRAHARARLHELDLRSATEARLRLALIELGERATSSILAGEPNDWAERIESHDGTIGETFAAAGWETHADELLHLAAALAVPRFVRGRLAEGAAAIDRVIDLAISAPPVLRVRALAAAGGFAEARGDLNRAHERLDAAVREATPLEERGSLAAPLLFQALVAFDEGEMHRARQLAEEALPLVFEAHRAWLSALGTSILGMIALRERDYASAEISLRESLRVWTFLRLDWGIALATANVGVLELQQGQWREGSRDLLEALARFQTLGDRWGIAMYLDPLARAARAAGFPELAARLFGAHAALLARIGANVKPVYRRGHEASLAETRAALTDRFFDAAFAAGLEMDAGEAIEFATRTITAPVKIAVNYGELSPREIQVLRHMARGQTDQQIAESLFIALRTVTTHASSIYTKLGVANRTEATATAVRLGIV